MTWRSKASLGQGRPRSSVLGAVLKSCWGAGLGRWGRGADLSDSDSAVPRRLHVYAPGKSVASYLPPRFHSSIFIAVTFDVLKTCSP